MVHTKHKTNSGWFKKGQIPKNKGKPLSAKARLKISVAVKSAMAKLPKNIQKRIKGGQFKKGHHYSHWKGKYGEEHPRYKGIAYRNKAIAAKGKKCEKCRRTKFDNINKIHVHHKDGNRLNNKLSNLKVLCSICHLRLHKNWEFRWGKRRQNEM